MAKEATTNQGSFKEKSVNHQTIITAGSSTKRTDDIADNFSSEVTIESFNEAAGKCLKYLYTNKINNSKNIFRIYNNQNNIRKVNT